MNLQKIALEAGVSVSTVSKAFNNAADISDKTRSRIFEISKKYGCYSKYIKTRYDKKVIAVICGEINSEHYSAAVEIFKKIIEDDDGIMLVAQDNFDSARTLELIDYFAHKLHVDGIISFNKVTVSLNNYDTPVVFIGSCEKNVCVNINIKCSMKNAIRHLNSLNHKNIAFISEKLTIGKLNCFVQCMNEMHQPLSDNNLIVVESRFENAGKFGADKLVLTGCTAAICAYDYIAFGVIDRLGELGYCVPEDYSVVGMDNIRATKYKNESLTTISYPYDKICRDCFSLLIKKIKNKYYCGDNINVSTELIVRGSTGYNKNTLK